MRVLVSMRDLHISHAVPTRRKEHCMSVQPRTFGVLAIAACLAAPSVMSQDGPVTLEAVAVSLGDISRPSGTAPLTIRINRWSTDEERNQLRDVMVEKGDDRLLQALQRTKPVGNLSTTGSLGWDIHYAHQVALPDGGRRIVFATDRPMSFAERAGGGRSRDYEYLLGEVRVGPDGKGQGKLVPRANISYDAEGRTLIIENYDSQPVRLSNVRLSARK
jgi:hypothetical protein